MASAPPKSMSHPAPAMKHPKKLGELASTADAGGPVALRLVAAVLYLFRSIHGAAAGSLPKNSNNIWNYSMGRIPISNLWCSAESSVPI